MLVVEDISWPVAAFVAFGFSSFRILWTVQRFGEMILARKANQTETALIKYARFYFFIARSSYLACFLLWLKSLSRIQSYWTVAF